MAKQKDKGLITSLIILAVIFGLYFVLSSEEPFFTAKILDADGDLVEENSLNTAKSVELTQSVFDNLHKVSVFTLQAASPIRESVPNYGVFTVVIDNPFDKDAIMEEIEVKMNNELLYTYEPVGLVLVPGESFSYQTSQIDLNGLIGQQNTIKIDALLKSGIEREYVSYEYNYLSVTVCSSDNDCPNLNPVCDLANGAKLSKDANIHYCVRICDNHNDCNLGQICKAGGFCGY